MSNSKYNRFYKGYKMWNDRLSSVCQLKKIESDYDNPDELEEALGNEVLKCMQEVKGAYKVKRSFVDIIEQKEKGWCGVV